MELGKGVASCSSKCSSKHFLSVAQVFPFLDLGAAQEHLGRHRHHYCYHSSSINSPAVRLVWIERTLDLCKWGDEVMNYISS